MIEEQSPRGGERGPARRFSGSRHFGRLERLLCSCVLSAFESSGFKCCSRAWGFEFSHACMHVLRKVLNLLWFSTSLYVFGHEIEDPRFDCLRTEVMRPDRTLGRIPEMSPSVIERERERYCIYTYIYMHNVYTYVCIYSYIYIYKERYIHIDIHVSHHHDLGAPPRLSCFRLSGVVSRSAVFLISRSGLRRRLSYRWNRNPRPQKFSNLVFLI